jgi:hypothetical protein
MSIFLNKDLFYSFEYAYDVSIYYVNFFKIKDLHHKFSIKLV